MPLTHSGKEELKRISLTLPNSLYEQFNSAICDAKLAKVEAIRQAISFWLENRIIEKMVEGYNTMEHEELQMLEEFKHVDREIW